MQATQISDYSKRKFTALVNNKYSVSHDVYSRGSGKVVVIIQELPGIGQETLALADRFVNRGYRVVLPHLFGPLGRTATLGNAFRVFCMKKEFRVFSSKGSSPIVDWLKALCRKVKEENKVKGVAVIGMCLTGNFAVSLMADDSVLAGYASQPSLPIFKQKSLHLSDVEVNKIKKRLDEFGPMHCGRFEGDKLCSSKKFKKYDQVFNGDNMERIKLHTLPGKGHAILTLDFLDEEGHPTKKLLEEVMDYFDNSLNPDNSLENLLRAEIASK